MIDKVDERIDELAFVGVNLYVELEKFMENL